MRGIKGEAKALEGECMNCELIKGHWIHCWCASGLQTEVGCTECGRKHTFKNFRQESKAVDGAYVIEMVCDHAVSS